MLIPDSSQLTSLLIANTLGLSVVTEVLKAAYSFFSPQRRGHFTTRTECEESYALIQGSGLEMILETYHLDYDAESLRSGFNYFLKRSKSTNGNGFH